LRGFGRDNHRIDQRDIEVGDAPACESREQIERCVALDEGDEEKAIRASKSVSPHGHWRSRAAA
jgi:hypothetical protein